MFVTSHPYYETMEVFSNNSTVTIILILTQQTQNICITFVQRRPKVFDVEPTLYKCYAKIVCLLSILVILMHTDTYYQK